MAASDLAGLGDIFLPWPDSGLTFRAPEAIPSGLRLSTDCPARRVLEFFDPASFEIMTEGTSLSGHLYADLFIQSLLPDDALVEMPIDWGPVINGSRSRTRLDAVVLDGPLSAHYELKTSSSKSPRPTAQNRRQVINQRAVAHLAGIDLPPSVIFVIGKSGHLSGYTYGPFEVSPSDDEMESAIQSLDETSLVISDILTDGMMPRDHDLLRVMCRCSSCYPPPREEADDEIRAMLDTSYEVGLEDYKRAKSWYEDVRDKLRDSVPIGHSVQSSKWVVTHHDSGRLTISRRDA